MASWELARELATLRVGTVTAHAKLHTGTQKIKRYISVGGGELDTVFYEVQLVCQLMHDKCQPL